MPKKRIRFIEIAAFFAICAPLGVPLTVRANPLPPPPLQTSAAQSLSPSALSDDQRALLDYVLQIKGTIGIGCNDGDGLYTWDKKSIMPSDFEECLKNEGAVLTPIFEPVVDAEGNGQTAHAVPNP